MTPERTEEIRDRLNEWGRRDGMSDICWELLAALDASEEDAREAVKLKGFISYIMADVFQGNIDGGAQDEAERLGLLELRPIPEENSIDGETEHYFLKWDEERP